MLYASELFCFYTRKLHAGASAVVDNAPASFSVLRNFGLKIKKIKKIVVLYYMKMRDGWGIFFRFLRQTKGIFRRRDMEEYHGTCHEENLTHFISFPLLFCHKNIQRENLRKRYGLEACTRRLVLESDQPSLLHYLSRLSLCSGNSMQSLGLAFNFHEKGILTAKIYSINWLQMGRANLPRSYTTILVATTIITWYSIPYYMPR